MAVSVAPAAVAVAGAGEGERVLGELDDGGQVGIVEGVDPPGLDGTSADLGVQDESPRVSWRLGYLEPAPVGTGVST